MNRHPLDTNLIYSVLNCVRLEGGFDDAEDLVVLALAIRPDQFPASDLHLAVSECLARGWIKVLTADDCRVDAARWQDEPRQNLEPYQEGAIDFTREGWELYVQQHSIRYGGGVEGLFSGCIDYLWDTPGQLSLIATSESTTLEDIAKIQSGEDNPIRTSLDLDADYQIVKIVGPYPIGPWWVNRFYQVPQAFRADILYKVAEA